MMRRSAMKPGAGLKRTAFARGERKEAAASAKMTRGMKTKQLAVTAAEHLLWDRLASEIGCIACMKDGRFNSHVSIHHVDGRTKPGCHLLVLPLCAPHHQDDGSGAVAVHPWKARFEARYGTQAELMALCQYLLSKTKCKAANGLQPAAASKQDHL